MKLTYDLCNEWIKMIISKSILITFKASNIFEEACALAMIY